MRIPYHHAAAAFLLAAGAGFSKSPENCDDIRSLFFHPVPGAHEGGSVLGLGKPGKFDASWATCPTIQKAPDGTLRMWYSSWYAPGFGASGIGMATSENGVRWERAHAGKPVFEPGLPGAFDSGCVMGPEVLFDGERYLMWYTGAPNTKHKSGFYPYKIGLASSADGLAWRRENSGNPVLGAGPPGAPDEVQAATPSVLRESGGFRMWYAAWAPKPNHTICVARSADGIHWERENGGCSVEGLVPATAFAPAVCRIGNRYLMFFMTLDPRRAIFAAQSADGIRWKMLNNGEPVLRPSGSGYDKDIVGHPFVQYAGGILRVWVTGYDRAGKGVHEWRLRIGLAGARLEIESKP